MRRDGGRDGWRVLGPVRLEGVLRPGGDKSIAHRAVLFASLARGVSRLRGIPDAEDVQRTLEAMRALGVPIAAQGDAWQVQGVGLRGLRPAAGPIDCGNSGTTMRLLCGLLAAQRFESLLIGDASLTRRPMRRVVEPLVAMGARVEALGRDGRPPLRVGGGTSTLHARVHRLDVDSAQVRAALCLAGLYAAGPTRIEPAGASRDHTEKALRACGVEVRTHAAGLQLFPTRPEGWDGFDLDVPGDVSSAAFWIALGAVLPGTRLRVESVGLNPGRARYLRLLRGAGARLGWRVTGEARGEPYGVVQVESAPLGDLRLAAFDAVRCIDEIPALCAAAAIAGRAVHVRGAAELRTKETDRIAGLVEVLAGFGARAVGRADGLSVAAGTELHAGRVRSFGDHRLAMAAAMLALASGGTSRIDDVGCVRTSYPEFLMDANRLCRVRG